jgi:hypothetical protein
MKRVGNGVVSPSASQGVTEFQLRRRTKMKKFVAASLSAFAFLALAACTDEPAGDPGMMQEPAQQEPATPPADPVQ